MSFLRTLYGSKMPQARHPRANEQVNSYWSEDTESAREIARLMSEVEGDDDGADTVKKISLPAVVVEDTALRRTRGLAPLHPLLAQLSPSVTIDGVEGLNVDEMTPIPAQLSPSGLISIAAADIDEAARNNAVQVRHDGELDLEVLQALRQAAVNETASGSTEQAATARQILVENFLATMLATPDKSTGPVDEDSPEARRRFLSLLRRINELRSQQVHEADDGWDGLPYPQIMALPTFTYTTREQTYACEEDAAMSEDHKTNTMCAVCYTEYVDEEEVRALPCLHFYHRECIDQWLLHHRRCPICKHVVAVY